MKRLLLGTSALVAAGVLMSGPAAAAGLEASLNGYMEQWFGFRSVDNDDTTPGVAGGADFTTFDHKSDAEVHFNAKTTLDNGLKVHYHVELEGNTDGDQIDESYIRLTGSFGQFLMGSENSAQYLMGYGPKDYGITTLSGDDSQWINLSKDVFGDGAGRFRTPWGSSNIEVDGSCNDDRRLTYFTPRSSGFQFGLSYTPNCGNQDSGAPGNDKTISNIISVGANYIGKFDQASVKVSGGYSRGEKPTGNAGSDPETVNFGAVLGFGGFSLGGYYATTVGSIHGFSTAARDGGTKDDPMPIGNENTGYAIGLAYATGPWGVSIVWRHGDREGALPQADGVGSGDDDMNFVHLGAQYKLGPGVTLNGSIAYASVDNEADLLAGSSDDGFYVVGGIKVAF